MTQPGKSGNMNFSTTFKNKKVFLTGHTGFKGAWMSIWLSELGAIVKGYALTPERPSLYRLISGNLKRHTSVIADIRNQQKVAKEMLDFNPDFVFHMAAQPLVRTSYEIPLETFDINVMGTAHLLDAVKQLKKKCVVVIVTTDKVYKNPENGIPFKESDALGGYDPYSASKAAAEIITDSYRLAFFNSLTYTKHKKSIASARAGNVIGGGDFAKDRIIPDIIRALQDNTPVEVRNPSAVRPWQHVLEPISGYLSLAHSMTKDPVKFAGSYNFGPNIKDALPVETLVNLALKSWGSGNYISSPEQKAVHEAGLLKLNISKAANELHWKPKWNAKTAIEKSVAWYKENLNSKGNSYQLCLNTISAYIKK